MSRQGGNGALETNALFGENRLKLGLFGLNCDHGCAMTLVPEAYHLTWETTKALAVTADRSGFEALVPVARWKGIGDNEFNGRNFETYTWAAGLAAATSHITVVTTAHVQMAHPIVAAKAVATIDHISGGRSCLNVVTGWFEPEFKMFGSELLGHEERYAYATEWTQLLKKLWEEPGEFNYYGTHFRVEGGYSLPKPVRSTPPIMNAGVSSAGQDFISRFADIGYLTLSDYNNVAVSGPPKIAELRDKAARQGRDVKLWTTAFVVVRETKEAAEEYVRWYVDENGDQSAANATMTYLGITADKMDSSAYVALRRHFTAGYGGYPLVGTAQDVADGLQLLSDVGFDGVALSFVDFVDGLQRFNSEVLPILEQRGLRKPFAMEHQDAIEAKNV